MTREVEYIALEYQLPDAVMASLVSLGEAACKARAQADSCVVQTEDGKALADFEDGLRALIGVRHRRLLIVSRCGP